MQASRSPLSGLRPELDRDASQQRQILAGKVSAPPRRPGIVDRPRLVDRLSASSDVPFVLVSAPPGYGKTTLLALWGACDERAFGWVTLDSDDNDPITLAVAIVEALEPVVDLDPVLRATRSLPEAALTDYVWPALVHACHASARPFVLVLDDLHVLREGACHDAIVFVAERLPPGCQLAFATRTDPPYPLGSWRAHRRLLELRSTELALSDAEAEDLLAAAGVELAPDLRERLVERTEGWPAAVYLAALSLRDDREPEQFVERFAGTNRLVADFLTEDVLARQADDVVEFLVQTSILSELSVPLCDAVTAGSAADATLRELERGNLLVVPLDEHRQSYRYHNLFADYLRAELGRRHGPRVPELHRRAWQWYRDQHLTGRAVSHALAAGDVDEAAAMVASRLVAIELGNVDTLAAWLTGFTDVHLADHPPLAITAAWVAALQGDADRWRHAVDIALRAEWSAPMPDQTASFESARALMVSSFGIGGLHGMRIAAQRAVELEPSTSQWHALASTMLGVACLLAGDAVAARSALTDGLQVARDESAAASFALAFLALAEWEADDVGRAAMLVEQAYAAVDRPGPRSYTPNIAAFAVAAHLRAVTGDLAGAAVAVDRANTLMPQLTIALRWLMVVTRTLLATALAALDRNTEAAAYRSEVDQLLADYEEEDGTLGAWCDATALRSDARRRRNPTARELTAAEHRVLRLLAGTLTLREIGGELYVSRNTVRTHVQSIYRKLGVSCRADAVAAAKAAATAGRVGST